MLGVTHDTTMTLLRQNRERKLEGARLILPVKSAPQAIGDHSIAQSVN
jgi:hypothetical protein